MDKIKKVIVYGWLIVGLLMMYTSEAWEYIYLRQHGSEHPNENQIIGSMLLIWIAPIIVAVIINIWKNRGKSKQYSDFSWRHFGFIFFLNLVDELKENRAMKTVSTARALATETAINKAIKEIIILYTSCFLGAMILFLILDYIDTRKKKSMALDSTENVEKEWF